MQSIDYLEMTTTSIATSGAGDVTLTQITNSPTFTLAFGSGATDVEYEIEDIVNNKYETGYGIVTSGVLNRTIVQSTWSGSVYAYGTALNFGATPTSGNVRIRMSATSRSYMRAIPGRNMQVAGDANWRDYPWSPHMPQNGNGIGGTLTADREYYQCWNVLNGGQLSGVQIEVTTNVAASNMKAALYGMVRGLPSRKIIDFSGFNTATTGYKTDTSFTPFYIGPGWYVFAFLPSAAIATRGMTSSQLAVTTPYGRKDGYGSGDTVYASGSYTTGLPATATAAASLTLLGSSSAGSQNMSGLRIVL